MKKLVIFIGIALVLLVGGIVGLLAYVASNANPLIQSYAPQLEQQVSETLKMPVQFGQIDASIFSLTPSLTVRNPKLGGENDPRVAVGEFRVRLNLWDILSQKLTIEELIVDSPEVVLLKDAEGLAHPGREEPQKTGASKQESAPERETSPEQLPTEPFAVSLNSVAITNGSFELVEKGQDKPILAISDISLSAPVSFASNQLSSEEIRFGAQIAEIGTVSLRTNNVLLDQKENFVSLPNLEFSLIPSQKLAMLGAMSVMGTGIQYSLSRAVLETKKIVAETKNFGGVTLIPRYSVKEQSGTVQIPAIALQYKGQPVTGEGLLELTKELFALKELSLKLFGGTAELTGSFAPSNAALQSDFSLKGLSLNQMVQLAPAEKPIPLEGTLSLLAGKLQTSVGQKNPLAEASGTLELEVRDGSYTAANIAQQTLGALLSLPFVGERLFDSIPPKERTALDRKDTPLERLGGNFTIGGNGVSTENFSLKSPLFLLSARGRIGFDQTLDLRSSFLLERGLSLALASKTKELKGLLNKDERLTIPVAIKGTAQAPLILPDMEEIMKLTAGNVIKEKARDLLGDVLGGKKKDAKDGGGGLGKVLGF